MSAPSFRFSLERVRALRERGEDLAKQALAGALDEQRVKAEELDSAESRLADARACALQATSAPASAADFLAHQAYVERAEQAQLITRDRLQRAEQLVGARRGALAVAARDRQALDKLEQRRRREFEHKVARSEGIALDEIAINAFRRRSP